MDLPVTNRLDINLGYECNNNCLFCYFRDRKQDRTNISTAEAKALMRYVNKIGIEVFELTGGEVAIRPDIIELIRFAKNDLKVKKISIITNGSALADYDFAARTIEAGVDDVLVSLHGHSRELNDRLTARSGSFSEAVRAIENVKKIGASCRINTVVTTLNYKQVGDIAALADSLGVKRLNYIYFSPLDDAAGVFKNLWPRYRDTSVYMRELVDKYKNTLEMISIKVAPFCCLPGLEDQITDFYQNIYDPYEWDYYQRVKVRRGRLISDSAAWLGMICFMSIDRLCSAGFHKSLREGIARVEAFRHCLKTSECRRCKFDLICPGVWKEYARRFGTAEIKAVRGKKTNRLDAYLQKRFDNFYT